MEIIIQGLRAAVTHQEYAAGVGSDYPELYITTVEGKVMKRTMLPYGRKTILPVDRIPVVRKETLPAITQNLSEFFPNGQKIPYRFLEQVVAFFRKVMESSPGAKTASAMHAYEAMAHIVWSPETGYRVAIPTQRVSAAAVHFEFDHFDQSKEVVILDIHSHNNMGAFFSGTDDGDDRNKLGFSGVVGKLGQPQPEFKWRFNDMSTKVDVKLEDMFTMEEHVVPEEWMKKVSYGYVTYGASNPYGYQGKRAGSIYGLDDLDDEDPVFMRGNRVGKPQAVAATGSAVAALSAKPAHRVPAASAEDEDGFSSEDMGDVCLAQFRSDMAALTESIIDDEHNGLLLDFEEVKYQVQEVSSEPSEADQRALIETKGRMLGELTRRVVKVDFDTFPDELVDVLDLFADMSGLAPDDVYLDLSEYFLVGEEEVTGAVVFNDEDGWICPKFLTPEQAMAVLNTEGVYMIPDYESGFYLRGPDMAKAIAEHELKFGINIRKGMLIGPLRSSNARPRIEAPH